MRKPIEVLWIDDESKKDEYKIYYSALACVCAALCLLKKVV